jgi:MFS family permease
MLAFRALSGFGASVADALAGGVLSDLWAAEERGTAFAVFMAAPLLGPGLGPILGGFVSEGVGWRWIFWIMAIASGVCIFASIFLLHEMYEPRLIERRKKQARKRAGVPKPTKTAAEEWKTFSALMRHNLQRPFRMIATQVIVQILAVYMGILYGICFLFMYIYPRMWTEQYGQSGKSRSLNTSKRVSY